MIYIYIPSNRCLIELFCGVVCVVTLPFWHFCWCRGFCHRTESDIFFFLYIFTLLLSYVCVEIGFGFLGTTGGVVTSFLSYCHLSVTLLFWTGADLIGVPDISPFPFSDNCRFTLRFADNWALSIDLLNRVESRVIFPDFNTGESPFLLILDELVDLNAFCIGDLGDSCEFGQRSLSFLPPLRDKSDASYVLMLKR